LIDRSPNWFTRMSTLERQTFWACFAGWALDAMDFQTYAVVMPTLIGLWGLTAGQAGVLGSSTLLMSPLGGWLAGILADRIGRARVLRIAIVWFATFSFLSGFTNSFGQLLVTRSLQGFGFGGEWVACIVLIGEVAEKRIRGRAVGSVQSGWSVGYGTAVLLFASIFTFVPAQQAWRLLFFVGLVPALFVLWLCRKVEEPQIFKGMQSAVGKDRSVAEPLDIFGPRLLRKTSLASLIATGALGGNYITLTWLPAYLKTVRHLSDLNTGGYLGVLIAGAFFGYFASAHLSDAVGRRRTFVITSVGVLTTITIYTLLPVDNTFTLLLGFPLGFFQSGIVGGMGVTFAELFPTRVRAGGQGFSYNVGRGLGSAMPALVGYFSSAIGLGRAIGIGALCSYSLVLIGTFFLRESRGIEFESYDRNDQHDLVYDKTASIG
jgi:MFS family permease